MAVAAIGHKQHVALVDGLEAADAGAVEADAFGEYISGVSSPMVALKCCHVPGRSTNLKSTILSPWLRANQ